MAGIAAIFHADGRPAAPGLLRAMTGAMAYRGPDGIGHWQHGSVSLGQCQLQTTGESLEAEQPWASADGQIVLAMDGYLANWEVLRADLEQRGARLRNRSDAELVLHAYETWGDDFARHLDGEFALLLWDGRRQELLAVKDHQGLRALMWHWDGRTFVAATDMQALVAALADAPQLDEGYLAEVVSGDLVSPLATVWQGVHRLAPATVLRVSREGLSASEYWQVPLEVTIRYRREEEYFEHYRAVLSECVRRASRSHLPAAYPVSGGLDSSAVFAMAHQLAGKGALPAPGVRAYTSLGPPGTAADETAYARAVARHCGVSLTEAEAHEADLAWFTRMHQVHLDMPTMPNGANHIAMERKVAADGSRILVGGQGGDQWLEGTYNYYHEDLLALDWRGLATSFAADLPVMGLPMALRCVLRTTLGHYLPSGVKALARPLMRRRGDPRRTCPWLAPSFQAELARREAERARARQRLGHWGYKRSKMAGPWLFVGMEGAARQMAWSGLEPRNPMLSRAFIAFSAATPERMRRRGTKRKYIHRRALAGILPGEVLARQDKAELSFVFEQKRPDLEHLLRDRLAQPGLPLLDSAGALHLLETYCTAAIDERDHWPVWGIYTYVILLGIAQALQNERQPA